jgi:hypothetical protein
MDKMPMLDKAAELDAARRSGQITKLRAIELLVEFADGGLTRVGALDVLENWPRMKRESGLTTWADATPRDAIRPWR